MILPFAIPDLEIELIYDDINNINADIAKLWQANKDAAYTVKDVDSGTISYRIRLPNIPAKVSSKYSKLMTNLKHILDQSINASYFITYGEECSRLNYPNGIDEVSFKAFMNGKPLNLLLSPVRDAIIKSQPFKGGNDGLYELCRFARIKHRPVYLDIRPTISNPYLRSVNVEEITFGIKFIEDEGCYELATAPIGTENNFEFGTSYEITLLEKGPFFQKNAIECVFNLLEIVGGIHTEIKAAHS